MSNESLEPFRMDFSYKSNELKSFYKGNSNITMISLKSANSLSVTK